ncbi:oxaloacetate decarboxylase, partial [Salmonella enterica subsp. enterica serovar Montevideo str. ATCC BAA710]
AEGDVLLILEAIEDGNRNPRRSGRDGRGIAVKSGDAVSVGDTLMTLA